VIRRAEPVVVVVGDGREALADIIVADGQSGPGLHERYPGLTLALVVRGSGFVARFRDGTESYVAGTPAEALMVARRLYRQWLISRAPARPVGRAAARRGQSPTL